jgi:plasmid stability protein
MWWSGSCTIGLNYPLFPCSESRRKWNGRLEIDSGHGLINTDIIDIMISYFIRLQRRSPVAQFVVRDLEDEVKARLKRLAERHGRSMEEEVRHILRNAAKESNRPVARLGTRVSARFRTVGLTTDLPEMRGQFVRSMDLDD